MRKKHSHERHIRKNSATFVTSAGEMAENILTHFTLHKGRNLGNFAITTGKGIWRSCFVYVLKRATSRIYIRRMA